MRRVVAPLVLLIFLPWVLPAHGGGSPLLDPAGDANGLNGQGIGLPGPRATTAPASAPHADIRSVHLSTVFKGTGKARKASALQITLTLQGAPQTGVVYLVDALVTPFCDRQGRRTKLQVYYRAHGALDGAQASCSGDGTTDLDVSAVLDPARHTVTWKVEPTMPLGAKIHGLAANTNVFAFGVFDDAMGLGSFKFGS